MNCEEALLLISGHLDQMNTPEEEAQLQKHLTECETCRGVLQAFLEIDEETAALYEEAPAGLCEDVMAAIRKESGQSRRKHRWWPAAVSAAAVALVLGMTGLPGLSAEKEAAPAVYVQENKTMAMAATADYSATADTVYAARSVIWLEPQAVAEEYGGDVAVTAELLPEMEVCPCETLADGSLLYCLPGRADAGDLSEAYGLDLFCPGAYAAEGSFALLRP